MKRRLPLDLLFLAQCLIGLSVLFYLASMRDVVLRFVPDDAFYYFTIARNWANGVPSSFDGLTHTNGYHPLWQWLLIPVANAINDPHHFARIASILGLWFYGAAAILLRTSLLREQNPYAWFAAAWTISVLLFSPVYGMEGPLCVVLFAGLWMLTATPNAITPGRALAIGLVSGLFGLSRIDHLVWALALDVWLVLQFKRKKLSFTSLALAGAVQGVLVCGYFLSNYLVWGHWLPVSAMIKVARSGFLSLEIPYSILYGVSLFSVLPSLWAARKTNALAWLGWGNVIYVGMILMRGGQETWDWYFALPAFSLGILLPAYLRETRIVPRRWRNGLLALACLVAFTHTSGEIVFNRSEFVSAYNNATALAEHDEYAYTFAYSDCGILGYFSRQRWLNMDGLTLDFSFQEALRDKRLPQWLREHGLNAYIDYDQEPYPDQAIVYSWPGIGYHHDAVILKLKPGPSLNNGRRIMTVVKISPELNSAEN